MARETVGEEEGEDEDEEEEKGEVEENATEEEVEGKEKTVVGKPGWPRGVRMIVFVPERDMNGGRKMRCKRDNVQSSQLASGSPHLSAIPNHHNFHSCIARWHNGGTLSESAETDPRRQN